MKPILHILFCCISFYLSGQATIFDKSFLHEIRIETDEENLLQTSFNEWLVSLGIETNPYHLINVTIDGDQLDSVGIRVKGGITAFEAKKPLKIDFDQYLGTLYQGLEKINLSNASLDNTLIRENLAYDVMLTAGVPAGRTSMANVFLNDEYLGVYQIIEQVDNTFLHERFAEKDGPLYKERNGGHDVVNDEDDLGLVNTLFFNTLDEQDNVIDQDMLESILDVEAFMKIMAIAMITNSADNLGLPVNYYIFHDVDQQKLQWIPWDMDNCFFPFLDHPIDWSNTNDLYTAMMKIPEYRDLYYSSVCHALEYNFTPERLHPIIDEMAAYLRNAAAADPILNILATTYDGEIGLLKEFVTQRHETLSLQLDAIGVWCNEVDEAMPVGAFVINEFMASNSGADAITDELGSAEDWVELYNNTDQAIDLTYYYLSDNPQLPYKWKFPDGAVLEPNAYQIVWCDRDVLEGEFHSSFQLNRYADVIQITYLDGSIIDTYAFNEQERDLTTARMPNGVGDFTESTPTFNAYNGTLSISNLEAFREVHISPNPTSTIVKIALESNQINSIRIYSMKGESQYQNQHLNTNTIEVSVENWGTGTYLVLVTNDQGKTLINRIVVVD